MGGAEPAGPARHARGGALGIDTLERADRRQHHRQPHLAAKTFDRGVDLGDVAQHARPERDLVKRHAVAAHGGFGLGGADDVIAGILVEIGAGFPDELVKVLEFFVARAKLDILRWPDRLVHLVLPDVMALVALSRIAYRAVTPSQNCMACGRDRRQ